MRSDDDSWDITESVGATALGVAVMRAAETRRSDALFRDPYAARLVEAAGSGWNHIMRAQVAATSDGADSGGEGGRGYSSAWMLVARTVYFDEYLAAASAAGVRQVVILASGLDARAYRLEWPSGTVVFEIDQPKVLEYKDSVLAGVQPAADRRAIGVDLRQDWPKKLCDNGFDSAAPTAWLAEGLLRYLPGEAQDRLCGDIAALSAPGSRIGLNIGRGGREDSPALHALRERRKRLLAEAGIRLKLEELWYPWEGRTDPRDWFTAHGWAVTAGDPAVVLSDHGRELPEAARAELNRHILMTATRGDENR